MGCLQSQEKKEPGHLESQGTMVNLVPMEGLLSLELVDTVDIHAWSQGTAKEFGFSCDVDFNVRARGYPLRATQGRKVGVLLPAPVNSEELDCKYTYKELQIEESWLTSRVKLKKSYKSLLTHKFKHLEAPCVVGCRNDVLVVQLILVDECEFIVIKRNNVLHRYSLAHENKPCLYECVISPDYTTFVLLPVQDGESLLLSTSLSRDNVSAHMDKQDLKRINQSNILIEESKHIHVEHKGYVMDNPGKLQSIYDSTIAELNSNMISFDPRYGHSQVTIATDTALYRYSLSREEITKTMDLTNTDQGLVNIAFSPCGHFLAATIIQLQQTPTQRTRLLGINLHDSNSLQVIRFVATPCLSIPTSLASLFPLFNRTAMAARATKGMDIV
ncbi:hypothetical protein CAPTEDRAFT_198531 [Capitella teleta]|uniref:Uncharacterized protein n=1 Tax=Capitella teleta TaxID=283909 RepID=R7U702_CAPTE|nr:hypothetical protein CAPTEDRAFT_198531 [Capitella teleta]|eukprot:ELT98905.1 hypothetical protein CAPTEDRAFT_198531 [Capitella teleta]